MLRCLGNRQLLETDNEQYGSLLYQLEESEGWRMGGGFPTFAFAVVRRQR